MYAKYTSPPERYLAWQQQGLPPALLTNVGMRFVANIILMKNTDLSHIEESRKYYPEYDPEVIKILMQTVDTLHKYLNPGTIEENKIPDSVTRFKDMALREHPRGVPDHFPESRRAVGDDGRPEQSPGPQMKDKI